MKLNIFVQHTFFLLKPYCSSNRPVGRTVLDNGSVFEVGECWCT